MSYLSEAIEYEKSRNASGSDDWEFNQGLLAGFRIAVQAYGIWRNGSQRIGASDKTIQECREEFEAALKQAKHVQKETK